MVSQANPEAPQVADASVISEIREAWLKALAYRLVVDIMIPAGLGHHADLKRVQDGLPMVDGKEYDEEDLELVPLTEAVNVSCSWPSSGGIARKKRTIGEHWSTMYSTGKTAEIFISPSLDGTKDGGLEVAATLLHELLHAAKGTKAKHGRSFAAGCARLGLEGKPTATHAGEELAEKLKAVLLGLPPYPHARIDARAPMKSEQSRQLKVFCKKDECPSQEDGGFKFRLTRKWIAKMAAGRDHDEDMRLVMACPFCNGQLAVELPEEENEEE